MRRLWKESISGLIAGSVLLGSIAVHAGQYNRLRNLELLNMGGSYRVQLTSERSVTYVNRFDAKQNRLTVYLKNTRVFLQQNEWRYRNGLVRKIKVAEWRQSPPVAKIDIYFIGDVNYQAQKNIDGVILIDVERKAAGSRQKRFAEASVTASEEGRKPASVVDLTAGPAASPTASDVYRKSQTVSEPPTTTLPSALRSTSRISLDVHAAEISNVLRLLARQSKLNIVASKEVAGNVTVSLRDVTIREALDMIVKANGLEYTIDESVVLVKPRERFNAGELVTKVYRLKYLDANNLKEAVAQLLTPQAKVQVFYQSFRKVTPTAAAGDGEKEKSGPSNRSSTLIVTDSGDNIRQLDAMIQALDVPTPQIMIEAKLVEVSPQHEKQLGINWDKSINAEIFNEVLLPSGQPFQYTGQVPLGGGSVSYGTLSVERYNAVLNFLSSKTNSKLVSNPRITAMDNEEALISVGTTFPIPQINRGVGGQGDVVTFEYRDVNIELRVTPHVGEDDHITLFVNPQVEEVIGQVSAGGNSAPITSKRTVETVVNLRNNETMVIGGLIRENTTDTIQKVWLLGDIPLIGNFFRNKNVSRRQTDLLIFITPRLIGE